MATIAVKMTSLGKEPQTCTKPFVRGEIMYAVEYDNSESAGWHNQGCIDSWKKTGQPKCMEAEDGE